MDISHLPSLEDHVRDKEILSLEKKRFVSFFFFFFLPSTNGVIWFFPWPAAAMT